MTEISNERADEILAALSEAGFGMPYGPARVEEFINGPDDPPPGPKRAAAIARLRAADEAAHEQNRRALREALA